MPDDADLADSSFEGKHSKRALFKNALARTKSKFKRDEEEKDFTLSDDVNDFLSAGKQHTHEDDRLPFAPSLNSSASDLPPRHPSPRGVPVPRLDVSQSTRFPEARPVVPLPGAGGNQDLLKPVDRQRERSHSFNSFKKKRLRPRNLSVSFDSQPPVIIGLGGDDAEQPPLEISRLRHTKSLSPMPNQRPGSNHSHSSQGSVSSMRRKPVPPHTNPFDDDALPPIRPLQRAPTGFDSIKSPVDREYEMSLGEPAKSHTIGPAGHFQTPLVSPKPIHPPIAPPQVRSPPRIVPVPSFPSHTGHPVSPIGTTKQGAVQVVVTDGDLVNRQPTAPKVAERPPPVPARRSPNAAQVMPHQKMVHRSKPSLNETETMNHGTGGWL